MKYIVILVLLTKQLFIAMKERLIVVDDWLRQLPYWRFSGRLTEAEEFTFYLLPLLDSRWVRDGSKVEFNREDPIHSMVHDYMGDSVDPRDAAITVGLFVWSEYEPLHNHWHGRYHSRKPYINGRIEKGWSRSDAESLAFKHGIALLVRAKRIHKPAEFDRVSDILPEPEPWIEPDYSMLGVYDVELSAQWLNEEIYTKALIDAAMKVFNVQVVKGDFKVQQTKDGFFTTDLAEIISAKTGVGGFDVQNKLMATILALRYKTVNKIQSTPLKADEKKRLESKKRRKRSPK